MTRRFEVGSLVPGCLVLALLVVGVIGLGLRSQVAVAHDPSECPKVLPADCPACVCPVCQDVVPVAQPSPEQVQAVQRAFDAIEAVEAVEGMPLGTGPAATLPPRDTP